jgi:diaminohydroxyphosphoribosylaminopyrimidine deaminase / 5-amino-6-(5-phosphoribosylamino)uracil reductase
MGSRNRQVFSMNDAHWMQLALELARRGQGFVEPNPMVGAVVVRDGALVGEGWHRKYGEAHAEVEALMGAGILARGSTLYVTLEPCCHWGKTPPCADAVIKAGVRRVVMAMADPFPAVSGGGIRKLREAGIEVAVGTCEAEARQLNAPYLTLVLQERPFVHAKWAMTLDGKIATHTGQSKWISSEESRRVVHELRGRMDAIIVGAGTVRADDPLLTARPPGPRKARRVALSSNGLLPTDCQLLRTARETPVLVAGNAIDDAERSSLESAGCEVLAVNSIADLLTEFGRRRFTNVLVEGGAAVFGSCRDAGLIDEVHAFIAPLLLGGSAALGPMRGLGAKSIPEAPKLEDCRVERLGDDIYVNGRVNSRN